MSPKLVIIIVFVLVMMLWLLALLGGAGFLPAAASGWLPWFAVACLAALMIVPGGTTV